MRAHLVLIVLSSLLAGSCIVSGQVTGGIAKVSIKSKEAQTAAKKALELLNKTPSFVALLKGKHGQPPKHPLKLYQIKECGYQVVSGAMYYLTLRVRDAKKQLLNMKVKIWWQPFNRDPKRKWRIQGVQLTR